MTNAALHPTSLERAKNRLAHDITRQILRIRFAEKRQAQQYALKLEILAKVIASFASMFRTLRERAEQRLEVF